jgi:hypothetical protein
MQHNLFEIFNTVNTARARNGPPREPLRVCHEITVASCLDLLPGSFVVRSLQIASDMRLAHASLPDKISAASCDSYFPTDPNWIGAQRKRKDAGKKFED